MTALRNAKLWAQPDLASAAEIDVNTVKRIEPRLSIGVHVATVRAIARALNVDPSEILADNEVVSLVAVQQMDPFDNNVGRIPANPLPIPEWSAEIACGHWIDCSTAALDPDTQMAIIRAGRFRVRVMGDSMLPKYKPGACVQFRIVRMDEEALQIGAHYYVQNSDGQCTLKVLKAIEEDEYVLAPTNRKYKPLRIAKQMVARWAIVETIVVAPWE